MPELDFIPYLKTLKPEDWDKMATAKWTVKDVVAHMVGWEKGDAEAIRRAYETKQPPWWVGVKDYDEFNQKSVDFYKNCTSEQLIAEWERWQREVEKEIARIGEDNLKKFPELFSWLSETGDYSHYGHHYRQIKKAAEGN